MTHQLPLCFINGFPGESISAWDRGFAYGDGLFESCRIFRAEIPLWSYHCQRLLADSTRLGIACDPHKLERFVTQALEQARTLDDSEHLVLKVVVTRGSGGRGYQASPELSTNYCIYIYPGAPLSSKSYSTGARARICDYRLPDNPRLAGIKHLNRLDQVLARAEWQQEYDDGLLLDSRGNLVEGVASNLFAVIDNELVTPDLQQSGVSGVMRRLVVESLAPKLALEVQVRPLAVEELSGASEVMLTNSLAGIWPLVSIVGSGRSWSFNPGKVVRSLQSALEAQLFAGPVE